MAYHKTSSGAGKFLTDNRRIDPKYFNDAEENTLPGKKRKKYRPLRGLRNCLIVVLIFEILYCVAIFSNIPFIARLRSIYIGTAMDTFSHQWLATAFIPKDIIDEVVDRRNNSVNEQIGNNSHWIDRPDPSAPASYKDQSGQQVTVDHNNNNELTAEQKAFFEVFWEVDPESMLSYVKEHPDVTANGWDQIYINEAGLDDKGTSIKTVMGEQVLAIDAKSQVMLVRVTGKALLGDFRGVLAVAKDPSKLHLYPAKELGSYGEKAGSIAERNDGILAITGSGFIDEGGGGNGDTLAGIAVCDGEYYRHTSSTWGYKRIELHEDNLMYITDVGTQIGDDVTDASEFSPALIVDGKVVVDENCGWMGMHPRACIGQSDRGEILMLVIEGRSLSSEGADVVACAELLSKHNCYQALNLDGGTSAIMWFDGEYVTHCSNAKLDEGRYLPNAWVYAPDSE